MAPPPIKTLSKGTIPVGGNQAIGDPPGPRDSYKSPEPFNRGPAKQMNGLNPVQKNSTATQQTSLGGSATANSLAKGEIGRTYTGKDGNAIMGQPKVYDSVGDAGSGFVNLSHLLGLNGKSGQNSAADLAKRTKATGDDATGAIQGAEDTFNSAALGGMSWRNDDPFDPAANNAQDRIDSAKNAQYTGPEDLASGSGYADLQKKVGAAQDMAKNSQDAYGVAAQVNKETGLSPTQSAASSFYMGVNNPNIKQAGAAFTNLQQALEKANSRALASSNFARGEAGRQRDSAAGMQAQKDDFDTTAKWTAAQAEIARRQAEDQAQTAARNDTIKDNHPHDKPEIEATSNEVNNIQRGMPGAIAYTGITWEEWEAEGFPDADTYFKNHPEKKQQG